MSDLLIKGMDLPKEGRVSLIAVFSDGDVKYIDRETFLSFRLPKKAIEVPDHGDLKDYDSLGNTMANKMEKRKYTWNPFYYEGFREALKMLDSAPTIIEASKEIKK